MDGGCKTTNVSPTSSSCQPPFARAGEDYTAVNGEVIFSERGSRTIRIPILDDDLVEGSEEFTVVAVEEPPADPWPYSSVIVRISDDETDYNASEPAAAPVASTTPTTTARAEVKLSDSSIGLPPPAGGAGVTQAATAPSTPTIKATPSNNATSPTGRHLRPTSRRACRQGSLAPRPSSSRRAKGPLTQIRRAQAMVGGRRGGGPSYW